MASFLLRLYVRGESPGSRLAVRELRRICADKLAGLYAVEVVDLSSRPDLGEFEDVATVLARLPDLPLPVRRVLDDLSAREKVLVGLHVYA